MSDLLDSIESPRDLKNLNSSDLVRLAEEIRRLLVDTISVTGGHLAPNLGVVELTLALHRVFDAPRDLIVWDVGHQAYVHKLLTGRRERFATIRQRGGLSGFPKPEESCFDPFGVGHGSTSISAALGMAAARDLAGREHHVVAVIGDGSMTGGMAFEGLNQVGELHTDMIVILNDNGMSISPNVGALSRYLQRVRVGPTYTRAKRQIEDLVQRFDHLGLGTQALDAARRLKQGAKHALLPGALFEDLGVQYLGPVDGHDIDALIDTLRHVKDLSGPRLLHVMTQKGRGYEHAEKDAEAFHGIRPFDVPSGKQNGKSTGPSFSTVFGDALCRLAEADDRVVAITAAMRVGTGLSEFAGRYPGRFFDVGMAEEHAVTFAAGLATQGLRPFVAIYSTFMQRSYDQIVHDVCLQNLPVTLCLDRAGLVGPDGPTHHGVFDVSYLRHIPGLVVAAPRDGSELERMLELALRHEGPMAIRYPAASAGAPDGKNGGSSDLAVGRGEVLREGRDVAIIGVGPSVYTALSAAAALSEEGIDAAVIDARFIKPLDADLIRAWAERTGALITVEDGVLQGGFGSEVLEMLSDQGRAMPVVALRRLGVPDEFVPHGSRAELLAECGIDATAIIAHARDLVAQRSAAR